MKNSSKLYEVEIKSMALIREGQKSFITYFQGGTKEQIVRNVMQLYPQYTAYEDKPVVNITPITLQEYERRLNGGTVVHKEHYGFAPVKVSEVS